MKKCFLLFILLHFFNPNALAMENTGVLALASVGLLSTSCFCGIEAGHKQAENWNTRDPYQKRALIQSRNGSLAGALLNGLPGGVLLKRVAAQNTQSELIILSAIAASGLFAISGAFLIDAKNYDEEYNITGEQFLADMRDRSKHWAVFSALCGLVICVPLVHIS